MPDFNGETLTITLDSGVRTIDVQSDLYSAWKEWVLSEPNNRKYPQAFRTTGGDDLTPGIKAGAYFFLRNDLGWRIKPAEEDATILVEGNLAPENHSLPVIIPTDGDFTVLLAGLQPITQSVEDILIQNQIAEYDGIVVVNFAEGESGTEYPVGLTSNPVNNVQDAFTIADKIGAKAFEVTKGTFVLDRDVSSYKFMDGGGDSFVDINGFDAGGTLFIEVGLKDTDFSGTTSPVRVVDSTINNVSNLIGICRRCSIIGTIKIGDGNLSFHDSYSIDDNNPATFDGNGKISQQLNISSWSGNISLKNINQSGFIADIDLISGVVDIDNTNTAGTINLRGIGRIIDNSSGVNLSREGFIEGTDIIQLRDSIYLNTINGVSGTTENVGTIVNPVNNIDDAFTLSQQRNLKVITVKTDSFLVNPVKLNRSFDDYRFRSEIAASNGIILIDNQSVNRVKFTDVVISGQCQNANIATENALLVDLSGFTGVIDDSSLTGELIPADTAETSFEDCFSLTTLLTPNKPTLNMVNITNRNIQFRRFSGDLTITNLTSTAQTVTVDLNYGTIILDNTNTSGNLIMRGIGKVVDNSGGNVNIDIDNMIDPAYVEELHRLQGLKAGVPMKVTQTKRTAGNLSLTLSGDGETETTVTRD